MAENDEYNQLSKDEELRAENEISALKFDLKHGGMTHISPDCPPELAKEWMELVNKREEAFLNAEMISIFNFIGAPEFVKYENIHKKQLRSEIEKIEALLHKYSILIGHPEHLTDEGWYRFLTEDFFNHEIHDYREPGLMHTFDYSEFREDGLDFAASHARAVVEDIVDLSKPYQGVWLSEQCRSDQSIVSREEVIDTVQRFRLKYKEIIPVVFSIQKVQPQPDATFVIFGIEWTGIDGVTGEREEFNGPGVCQLNLYNRVWLVEGIMFPGFEF